MNMLKIESQWHSFLELVNLFLCMGNFSECIYLFLIISEFIVPDIQIAEVKEYVYQKKIDVPVNNIVFNPRYVLYV